ncbi:MAG: hypothetical protein AB2799_13990, partial [Candidatus Thiodiazotropha sp.]
MQFTLIPAIPSQHTPPNYHPTDQTHLNRIPTTAIDGFFLVTTLPSGTRQYGAKYLNLWLGDDLVNYNIVIVGTNLNNQKV